MEDKLKPKDGYRYVEVKMPDIGITMSGALDQASVENICDVVLSADVDREYTRAPEKQSTPEELRGAYELIEGQISCVDDTDDETQVEVFFTYGQLRALLYNKKKLNKDAGVDIDFALKYSHVLKCTVKIHGTDAENTALETLIHHATRADGGENWETENPTEHGYYMVTTTNECNDFGRKVELSRYGGSGWYADHDGRKVIAWRRIPEPFKKRPVRGGAE